MELTDQNVFPKGDEKVSLLAEKRNFTEIEVVEEVDAEPALSDQQILNRLKELPDRPMYVDMEEEDGGDDHNTDSCIHWYYGDQGKTYEIINLLNHLKGDTKANKNIKMADLMKKNVKAGVKVEPGCFKKMVKYPCLKKMSRCFMKKEAHGTIGGRINQGADTIERYDNYFFYVKLIISLCVLGYYMGKMFGYNQGLECKKTIAIHNFSCIANTVDCSQFVNENNPKNWVFYCTAADFKAKNKKFCKTGYCSTGKEPCNDHELYKRIDAVSDKYRKCVFKNKKDKGACTKTMDNGKETYINCRLGVEIYIFVFLFSKVILESFCNSLDKWTHGNYPITMIIARILITLLGVAGWYVFLYYKDHGLGASSIIDLVYVFLFIGINVFLETFKLCRLKYMPKHSVDKVDEFGRPLSEIEILEKNVENNEM